MSGSTKTAYVILGPTASGKTELAIALAQQLNTEIISADSRQCYSELAIGVARPAKSALESIPHHFIASHSIHEHIDVALFEQYALDKITSIFSTHDQVVVCGGTGLYLHAFCYGMDNIPPVNDSVREKVLEIWKEKGLVGLQNQIQVTDPFFWEHTHEKKNRVRLMRALEVKLTTGASLLDFQHRKAVNRPFHIKKIYIDWPRNVLYERIEARVEKMMQDGLLDEVRSVYMHRNLKALQTVGYQELFDYIEGKTTLDESVSLIKQHTRNYAKRQITWFKKEGWDVIISGESIQKGAITLSSLRI